MVHGVNRLGSRPSRCRRFRGEVQALERPENRRRAQRQSFEVVAPFEHDQPPPGGHGCDEAGSHESEVPRGETQVGDRIVAVRVETCRNDQPGRSKGLERWHDDLIERSKVHVTGGARREWNVDGRSIAGPITGLAQRPRPGIQRPLVHRDVQDRGVAVEHGLGAIAVMGVVVDDGHPGSLRGQRCSCDRHIGEQTKAHRLVRCRVMSRWSYRAERGTSPTLIQMLDSTQAGSSGSLRRSPGPTRGHGVGIETTAVSIEVRQVLEMRRGVHPLELEALGHSGIDSNQSPIECRHMGTPHDGLETLRALGVTTPGHVIHEIGVGEEKQRHGTSTLMAARGHLPEADYRSRIMIPGAATPSWTPPLLDLHGGGRLLARVRPWPDDPTTALLTVIDPWSPALAAEVPEWIRHLRNHGYRTIRTNAIDVAAAPTLRRHGFDVTQELTVLSLGRVALRRRVAPGPGPGRIKTLRWRRPPSRDRHMREVLALDRQCFDGGWHLDTAALREAITATPRYRARILEHEGHVIGYLIAGRAEDRGFLQRLGIHPAWRRQGGARILIADALDWLDHHRITSVLVNTLVTNQAALDLYRSIGFQVRPDGLVVLEHTAPDTSPTSPMSALT